MQKLNSLMLSALILAGLCLQGMAQEAEVEVIELEPGVRLKKKITKPRMTKTLSRRAVHLKKGDAKDVITFEIDKNSGKTQVIDLGNGNKAIIRIETGGDTSNGFTFGLEDVKTKGGVSFFEMDGDASGGTIDHFFEMQDEDADDDDDDDNKGRRMWSWSNGEGMAKLEEKMAELELTDLVDLGQRLESLNLGDWKQHANQLKKHLGDVQVHLDGSQLGLMELVGPGGLNLEKLHGAHDMRIHVGGHDLNIPLAKGKGIWSMFSGGGCERHCPGCTCEKAKKKSKKGSSTFYRFSPKSGKSQTLFGLSEPKKSKRSSIKRWVSGGKSPSSGIYSVKPGKKGSKSGRYMVSPNKKGQNSFRLLTPHKKSKKKFKTKSKSRGYFSTSKPGFFGGKALSKSKSGSVYRLLPSSKGNSQSGSFGIAVDPDAKSSRPRARLRRAIGRIVESGKGGNKNAGQALLRLLHEEDGEDGEDDDDDDDLEEEIEELENQLNQLRKELRKLKRRI